MNALWFLLSSMIGAAVVAALISPTLSHAAAVWCCVMFAVGIVCGLGVARLVQSSIMHAEIAAYGKRQYREAERRQRQAAKGKA